MSGRQPQTTLAIEADATVSEALFIRDAAFNRIVFGAESAGAVFAFTAAVGERDDDAEDLEYRPLVDATGAALTVTPTAGDGDGCAVLVVPDLWHGLGWFRLGGAANEAARTVTLVWAVR